jgi:dethiobiotin synthetase
MSKSPTTVLITGTDTAVGKTWVGCGLARAARERGIRVVAIKPVESGCGVALGGWEDGVLLAEAAGQTAPRQALVRLRDPVSPALALERTGADLDLETLVGQIRNCTGGAELVLVEGAGGLLSPITWAWDATDLARALGAQVLLVGVDRLGVVNHVRLTRQALELAGLALLGVVLTAPEKVDASTGTNAAAITRLAGVERILVAPRTRDPSTVAAALASILDWAP